MMDLFMMRWTIFDSEATYTEVRLPPTGGSITHKYQLLSSDTENFQKWFLWYKILLSYQVLWTRSRVISWNQIHQGNQPVGSTDEVIFSSASWSLIQPCRACTGQFTWRHLMPKNTYCHASTFSRQPDFVHAISFGIPDMRTWQHSLLTTFVFGTAPDSPIGSFRERERNHDSLGHEKFSKSKHN